MFFFFTIHNSVRQIESQVLIKIAGHFQEEKNKKCDSFEIPISEKSDLNDEICVVY